MHIAFHPKAFMSNFVFNTNVWASKDKGLQVAGTHLFNDRELFPFYYPANTRYARGWHWRHCQAGNSSSSSSGGGCNSSPWQHLPVLVRMATAVTASA
jgi:hypothetical protein